MRKICFIIGLLLVAGMAFSVTGRVFMRFGAYTDPDDTYFDVSKRTNRIGPMFSFWGVENNVDLWQGKDGTGFEVNFDSFGLQYKTREAITLPGSLDASGYTPTQRWGVIADRTRASSPGYLQIRNIRFGSVYLATGLGLWTLFGTKEKFDTNASGTNNDYKGSVNYVKTYMDFKVDVPLNENITIKMYDWELMWLEFYVGSSKVSGIASGTPTMTNGSANGFKCYIPPHLILNLDQFQMDFSPKVIFDNSMSNIFISNTGIAKTNNEMYLRLGATMRLSYNFDRVFGIYGTFGYFNESDQLIEKVNGTNSYYLTYSANIIPMYAGLKITVVPNTIILNVGYGMNLMINNTWKLVANGITNTVETGPQLRSGYLNNWITNQVVSMQVQPERQTYGDGLMDLAFIKFGATVKVVKDWEVGLAAAVSLNDCWNREYLNTASQNYTWTSTSGSGGTDKTYNWLSFLNWMDYDNNMYIKYENDIFAAKLTFDMWARNTALTATMLNMFSYLDLTFKF